MSNFQSDGKLSLLAKNNIQLKIDGSTTLIAKNNKVGINSGSTPKATLFVQQSNGENGFALQNFSNGGDIYALEIGANDLHIKYSGSPTGTPTVISYINEDGAYVDSSDKRLKDNIKKMDSVLDKIMCLKPRTYTFKHVQDKSQRTCGFLAQDIAKVMPELVRKADAGDYYGLRYDDFSVIAIKATR